MGIAGWSTNDQRRDREHRVTLSGFARTTQLGEQLLIRAPNCVDHLQRHIDLAPHRRVEERTNERPEADYVKALPLPVADAKVPEGDELKAELAAHIEDLECAKEVSKLVLGKVVTIGYKEMCAHHEDADIRLTMYEIALRVITQFDKHDLRAGLSITARADNGGAVFTQQVPAQLLQGIKDRQIGIVDWVTRSYAVRASATAQSAPRRDCHEGDNCVIGALGGRDGYLACRECCYGAIQNVGTYPYRCKYQGE